MVPLRASPVLTATAKPTVALPVPLGVARVIQGTFAVPVHAHAVVSVTDPPPAVAGIPSDTGLRAYVHSTGGLDGGDPDGGPDGGAAGGADGGAAGDPEAA